MTLNSEQAGDRLQKFLWVLIGRDKALIELEFIPEGKDGSMDYFYKAELSFKKGMKLNLEFLVSVSGDVCFINEPGTFIVVDNGGDMTEFWKFLFNALYKSIKPKL